MSAPGRADAATATRAPQAQDDAGSFAGRRILITGSTRGIGAAAVRRFAEAGARVVVHGRDPDRVTAAAGELQEAAAASLGEKVGAVYGLAVDLSSPGAGDALVARAADRMGGLDVVINNAAILPTDIARVADMSGAAFSAVMTTNLNAVFEVSAAAGRAMAPGGDGGRILIASSNVADAERAPVSAVGAYGVSKIAAEALSRFLAADFNDTAITVGCIRAPTTDTEMIRDFFPPDRRRHAVTPEDAAALYLWAASTDREQIHGRTVAYADVFPPNA